MKRMKPLLCFLIVLFCSRQPLRGQAVHDTLHPAVQAAADTIRTGDELDGIKYYLKLIPPDTTRGDRMPIIPPSDFTAVDKQPVPLKQVQPVYPHMLQSPTGTVWVKCLIGTDGKVKKTEVMKSDSEIFNEAAVGAAKQWLFTPAMVNGKPVETWAAIPFRFGKAR